MAQTSTLFRFQIELSDIDRGRYETLDFRTAMHPSETGAYLLTRVIAYALNCDEGLEFSPQGLGDPDVPALRLMSSNGNFELWIDIGNPSAKRMNKASKTAKVVKVYTYKDPKVLLHELNTEGVHKSSALQIFSIRPDFLEKLSLSLKRDNKWSFVVQDHNLTVHFLNQTESVEILNWKLQP